MAIRVRKRIRLGKGVYLNIGKRGVSTSVSAGGISFTKKLFERKRQDGAPGPRISHARAFLYLLIGWFIICFIKYLITH